MSSLLIAYGTLTMNSEIVASKLYDLATASGKFEQVELKNLAELIDDPKEIENYDRIIIGTSTWGDGGYPADTEDFMNNLMSTEVNIENKPVAFFGLGDSSYVEFCWGIDNVHNYFVNTLKAKQVGTIFKMDGFPDDENMLKTEQWFKELISLSFF